MRRFSRRHCGTSVQVPVTGEHVPASHDREVMQMPTFLRAAAGAAALSLILVGSTLGKGEAFSAAIGPIDNVTPARPLRYRSR